MAICMLIRCQKELTRIGAALILQMNLGVHIALPKGRGSVLLVL